MEKTEKAADVVDLGDAVTLTLGGAIHDVDTDGQGRLPLAGISRED